jgi:hypothetical protein
VVGLAGAMQASDLTSVKARRKLRFLLALALSLSVLAVTALGAVHHINDFLHGILSPSGYNCNEVHSRCMSWIKDDDGGPYINASLSTGMYHLRSDGGWNTQDARSCNQCRVISAEGPTGTEPCRKYAWNAGQDVNSYMAWHGQNTVQCGGSHIG